MRCAIHWFGAFLLLSVAASGCGASPRRGGGGVTGGGTGTSGGGGVMAGQTSGYTPGQTGGGASGDPRTILNNLAQHMTQQGYAAVGPAVHGNLPPNGIIAYAINSAPGTCYTVATIGGGSSDINIYVLDAAGQTTAYDVRPDAHPWASFCPAAAGRSIVRVQMAQGVGDYYYIAFQGPAQRGQVNLASFFGAAQEQNLATARLDPQTTQRLDALNNRLVAERFAPQGQPLGFVFNTSDVRDFSANLEAGCYAFATFGGPGARDTDLMLVDGAGNTIESDTATAVDATVRHCVAQPGTYSLRARMYAGRGPLFLMSWRQGAPAQQTSTVISQTSTAGAGLEENFRLLDGDMRARGYEAMGEQVRGQLPEGQTRDVELTLEGGKCYAVLAVGDNGVRDLDLLLNDSAGTTIDRDVQTDPRPIVRVCPTTSGAFHVQVRMFSGSGSFVYGAYRWPRGVVGPFGLRGLIYVRLAELQSLQAVESYEPDENFAIERGNLRREGEERTHDLTLANGQCYSISVVGGAGINDIDVTLMQGTTQLASDGTRNAFPSVRACIQAAGRVRIKVKATAGSGEYAYQVFRRTGT